MVEQGTENPRVGSSILSLGTTEFQGCGVCCSLFLFLKIMRDHFGVKGSACLPTPQADDEAGTVRAFSLSNMESLMNVLHGKENFRRIIYKSCLMI